MVALQCRRNLLVVRVLGFMLVLSSVYLYISFHYKLYLVRASRLWISNDSFYAAVDEYNMTNLAKSSFTAADTTGNISAAQTQDSPLVFCPEVSPLHQGATNISFKEPPASLVGNWPPSLEEIAREYPALQLGGYYPGPTDCHYRPEKSVAVIVPFRNRPEHLKFFLHYLHGVLQRQQARYMIVVAEQDKDDIFNKAQLMNTAYRYVRNQSRFDFDCFVFHDVDTLSEDDRTLYQCEDQNRVVHLSHRIDKFNYKFCCGMTIGGVLLLTSQQMEAINGFSNQYYGWGGEDDDLNGRLEYVGKFEILRPPEDYYKFKMLKHKRDKLNPDNKQRLNTLNNWSQRQKIDGLNSLETTLNRVVKFLTHTRLLIGIKPETKR